VTAELPPAVAFMLDEFRGKTLDLAKVRKKLDDDAFLRDFDDQCLAGIRSFPYADRLEPRPDRFDLYADGGLDPLSRHGKCGAPACRIAYAHHFARSACLYADRVVIPDPFSFGGFLDESPDEMFLLIGILKTLKPLLDAGIITFSPAAYGSCSQCMKAVKAARRHVADQLWREFKRSTPDVFRFKYNGRWRMSFGSPLFTGDGEEYRMTIPATKSAIAASKPNEPMTGAKARDLIRQYSKPLRANFARSAHGVVFSARMGGFCGTTVATNTKEEAVGYRVLDARKPHVTEAEWAKLRTVPLPTLRSLSAAQALAVREEAEKALPTFRAKLQRDLFSLKGVSDDAEDERAREVAAELGEAARQLEGQLASVTLPSIRRSEKLFVSLALALEIVALSTGNPAAMAAVSGTMAALLVAAHKSERDRKEKHELLVHQPAYVLLTAERVHAHKH
jgi:hypothetical protein